MQADPSTSASCLPANAFTNVPMRKPSWAIKVTCTHPETSKHMCTFFSVWTIEEYNSETFDGILNEVDRYLARQKLSRVDSIRCMCSPNKSIILGSVTDMPRIIPLTKWATTKCVPVLV